MLSAGFLSSHPDLRFRLIGQKHYEEGEYGEAFSAFRRAAHYGDKPAQGMVAEMLWNGQGMNQDRALAYAWMDLAAERGYEGFVGHRERYWAALDETERTRALEVGQAVYARYGDDASEPRLASVLRHQRKRQTSSRTGFTGGGMLSIAMPGPANDGHLLHIDGSKFYAAEYWEPRKCRALQDSIWNRYYIGHVDVGSVERVGTDGHPKPRVPATAPQVDAPQPQGPEPKGAARPGTDPLR